MKQLLLLLAFITAYGANAQKSVYIPLYIQDTGTPEGSQFSWDKTAESQNFILMWGNTVGTDPANYTTIPELNFNPQTILSTLEGIYSSYKNFGFIDDTAGTNLSLYKIPIIMLNTWGPGVGEGYAFGGDVDGVIGAFWVHPIAMQTGDVAAHELAHSIQAQTIIDYRNTNGMGPVWTYAGIFWETHANFMRNLLYPQDVTAWGMDVYHCETLCDWKNVYEGYAYLYAIMEMEGIEMINNLWKLSHSDEYPLQTYKRLGNYNQDQFNDKMFEYARRMATYDFIYNGLGDQFRQKRADDLIYWLPSVQATYTILKAVDGFADRYQVPVEISPEEYAYNVIPLYPDASSCSVIVKFNGHNELHGHSGWRYGFVAENNDGTVSRYSETYSASNSEVAFALQGTETKMYMVVMGAPFDNIQVNPTNDTWKGYPKHFRYPYELNIIGAKPEGFQAASAFRSQIKTDGHVHPNGGGWVQNSASVASSVFVAPTAIVLGNSVLTNNVRIENTALVSNAAISGNVRVTDNAFINGGTYTGDALVAGQAFVENVTMSQQAKVDMRAKVTNYDLSGNIEVGGDVVVYNENGSCNNGVYYRMTNYYEDNLLECDNRTATHPDNLDVNNPYSPFADDQMAMVCSCENFPECLSLSIKEQSTGGLNIYPNPTASIITIKSIDALDGIKVYNTFGALVMSKDLNGYSQEYDLDVTTLSEGMYFLRIQSKGVVFNKSVLKE